MAASQAKQSGYDPTAHHRHSIRLCGHDYAAGGVYFVTLCVADRRPLFGTVVNGRMALNDAGRAADACWRAIPGHFPQAALDEWIVMPDHLHGIIMVSGDDLGGKSCAGEKSFLGEKTFALCAGEKSFAPTLGAPDGRPRGTSRTLGSIVRGFKIGVTKFLGGNSPWQRNYYDIIVRDGRALDNIRHYIRDNPTHWDTLRYGAPRFFMGNRGLLNLPLTAFLASRTGEKSFAPCAGEKTFAPCAGEKTFAPYTGEKSFLGEKTFAPCTGEKSFAPTKWPKRPGCVISGFLSPMERDVFDACLAGGIPMVWILARGLPAHFTSRIHRALDAGRLLIMTPFDAAATGFSAARAAWCNEYALHLADDAVIGQLTCDGMLACLLADMRRDIPVHYIDEDSQHGT